MRKASQLCAPRECHYTPVFHCGDQVKISLDAVTPRGKFFKGFCGTVGDIDTWGEEYSYRVVLHHSDDPTAVIPSEVWIKESDLEFDEFFMEDDEDTVFCVYVPHGVETSLSPKEIREKYIYQRDDGEGVYYCTMSKEDYEEWLFDDIEEEEETPVLPKRGRGRPRKAS